MPGRGLLAGHVMTIESASLTTDAGPREPVGPSEDMSAIMTSRSRPVPAPEGWPVYLAACFVSAVWACGPLAFALGYQRNGAAMSLSVFDIAMLAAMALGPAAMVWIGAYFIQQGRVLRHETGRARKLADEMVAPALTAALDANQIVRALQAELATAAETSEAANRALNDLRAALAGESARLIEASTETVRVASDLAASLGNEREAMSGMARTLDAQSASVTESINRQARLVADAADLAETQMREAEASLAARSAGMTAAAALAGDVARHASEDLSGQTQQLEAAIRRVTGQLADAEGNLAEQRAALVQAGRSLKAEQEALAVQILGQSAQLSDHSGRINASAAEMRDWASRGGEALQALIAETEARLRDLVASAQAEREDLGQASVRAIEAVSLAAAKERALIESQTRASILALGEAADKTRQATENQAATARAQAESLSEAAFTAGQKANQVFDARLAEARALIEQSSRMAAQAGLETSVVSPVVPEAKTPEPKAAAAATARPAPPPTPPKTPPAPAAEADLQDRVRRNFEMLSEAVKDMGAATEAEAPLDLLSGERPRLRLTPTASDEEFSDIFVKAGGAALAQGPQEGQAWTWKDLLNAIDESPANDAAVEDLLMEVLEDLQIDPLEVLPFSRVDQAAASLQRLDGEGARRVVRRVAPAEVRQLSRRLMSDERMRRKALGYLQDYQDILAKAVVRDPSGRAVSDLLNSLAGRLYLLTDSAAAELDRGAA